jgi:multiple RNA-binding domain-containing protein 1
MPKDKPSKGKEKAKGNEQLEEFMQAMLPRSRKGPSWKDSDVAASDPSTSKPKKPKYKTETAENEPSETPSTTDEPASDTDWLRRHIKSSLDISMDAEEKLDQSDAEMDAPQEVCLTCFFVFRSMLTLLTP